MTITLPRDLSELFENEDQVIGYIRALKSVVEAKARLVSPDASTSMKQPTAAFKDDAGGGLQLLIPIQFSAAIADSTATAASVSTQLNALLAQLRRSGINPS